MAEKSAKIIDVKSPEKVAPAASSRPLLVTDRPVLTNDPMMVKDPAEAESSKPVGSVMNRTAKTIQPVETEPEAAPEAAEQATEPSALDTVPAENAPDEKAAEAVEPESKMEAAEQDSEAAPATRDSEAQIAAAESEAITAQTAREQELEQLIVSGKYVVPINALQRKRSHMYVALLCFVAVLLAVLLLDALLDAKIFTLPVHVPHTHFFSKV